MVPRACSGPQAQRRLPARSLHPDQLKHGTGGGNNPDTIPNAESLRDDLVGLRFTHLAELQRDVIEGKYHTGRSAVVQAIVAK
ncbi:MAG: hypothetical protein AAGB26_13335 [Planctomycetota bacterium]